MAQYNPIKMEFISVLKGGSPIRIDTLNSYSFDRSVVTPASAFRFTAGSVSKATRMAIRSGDTVRLTIDAGGGRSVPVATGFVDETDTHGTSKSLEYVITGRDTVGQLVDNATVDKNNAIIAFKNATIDTVVTQLLANTRLPQDYLVRQLDRSAKLALQTSAGETKINTLQRYLEFLNGLVWADPSGRLIIDKPDFTQKPKGTFTVSYSRPNTTNVIEFRVRRNTNQAIRTIVTQLSGTEYAAAVTAAYTLNNMDSVMRPYAGTGVGRSISRTFSYSRGADSINQSSGVSNGSYVTHTMATGYSAREVARENMRLIDVEVLVPGHLNASGDLYNVDQIYNVSIEDEDLAEPLYVYNVGYELTPDHGMMTRLRLCKLWSITAYNDALDRVVK